MVVGLYGFILKLIVFFVCVFFSFFFLQYFLFILWGKIHNILVICGFSKNKAKAISAELLE